MLIRALTLHFDTLRCENMKKNKPLYIYFKVMMLGRAMNRLHLTANTVLFLHYIPCHRTLPQSFAYLGFVFCMPAVNESVTSAVLQYAAFQTDTYLRPRNMNVSRRLS